MKEIDETGLVVRVNQGRDQIQYVRKKCTCPSVVNTFAINPTSYSSEDTTLSRRTSRNGLRWHLCEYKDELLEWRYYLAAKDEPQWLG